MLKSKLLTDPIQTRDSGSIFCDCPVMPLLPLQFKKHREYLDRRQDANVFETLVNVTNVFFLYDISRELWVILQQCGRKLNSAANIYYTPQ